MATVEQHLPETHNGLATAGEGIPVENPATGETIATVPDLGAEAVAEMAARGRAAQPGGRRSASRAVRACCCARRSG